MKDTNYTCVASVCGFYNVIGFELRLHLNTCSMEVNFCNNKYIHTSMYEYGPNVDIIIFQRPHSLRETHWIFSRSHSCFSFIQAAAGDATLDAPAASARGLQGWWNQQKGTALEQNTSTLRRIFFMKKYNMTRSGYLPKLQEMLPATKSETPT